MFDYNRAFQHFQTQCRLLHPGITINELSYRHMVERLSAELQHEARRDGRRVRLSTLEVEAADMIFNWYQSGHEYSVYAFDSGFVASHYRACVWAVFLRKEHMQDAITPQPTRQGA